MKHFIYFLIMILFLSCNSEEIIVSNENNSQDNFYALTIGNSWVYKYYTRNISDNSQFEYTGIIDSVKITNAIIIDNNTYFEYKIRTFGNDNNVTYAYPNGEQTQYLRDSLGYLIGHESGVRKGINYTNNDYNEYQTDVVPFGTYHFQLKESTVGITTEAGRFDCLDMHTYYRDTNGDVYPSLDHINYSKEIGLILLTNSFVSQNEHFMERRLDSYMIQ